MGRPVAGEAMVGRVSRALRIVAGPALIALAGLLALFQPALAQQTVTLSALDGSTEITGELIEFDGRTYTVRTSLGVISVPAAQVTCSGEGCPVTLAYGERVSVAGSNPMAERLLPALVEGYASDVLGMRSLRELGAAENEFVLRILDDKGAELVALDVAAHGTQSGLEALAAGEASIALASRQMAAGEAGLPDLRDGERELILALGGVVVVVNPENTVGVLDYDTLAAVFAGRVTNWAELGGPDQPVRLFIPPPGSGTRALFEQAVMKRSGATFAAAAETVEDLAELSDLVSIEPGAVGITAFADIRASRAVAIRLPCGIVSRPTRFALKAEEYPLSRRLYAYLAKPPAELPSHARRLLDYALSDAAQPVIRGAGFVDRAIESQGLEAEGARIASSIISPEEFSLDLMREMLRELSRAERLSVTFRFRRGSSRLDARSAAEAERFARLLAAGRFAGNEVLLVGFADSVGEFAGNRDLAQRRAERVLEALKAAVPEGALDGVPILVKSYGELTPVGCDDTPEGRELNRRVEVWIRRPG